MAFDAGDGLSPLIAGGGDLVGSISSGLYGLLPGSSITETETPGIYEMGS